MRRRLGVLVLGGAMLFGATSCGGGTKLAEVGPKFQQDAQTVLTKVSAARGLAGSKPTVKQDAGTDVPCGDGKAKRVFEASLPLRTSAKIDDTFDGTVDTVLANVSGYTVKTQPSSDDPVRREMTLRADQSPATLTAVLTATPVPTLTLGGETDCLSAG
ncbi:MAG TPA: hypothetical protein VGD71_13975 [Kribbella sp.]